MIANDLLNLLKFTQLSLQKLSNTLSFFDHNFMFEGEKIKGIYRYGKR